MEILPNPILCTLSPKTRSALRSSFSYPVLLCVYFLRCPFQSLPVFFFVTEAWAIILETNLPSLETFRSPPLPTTQPRSIPLRQAQQIAKKKLLGKGPPIPTMNHMGSPPFAPADHPSTNRKRSLSGDEPHRQPTPPTKVPKTNANHLQINYLARQYQEILPLISPDDPLPSLLSLISDYDGVLHRHESMAGNLGARPLGPILIQRFERLFDGPPRVLKTHGKEGTSVGWLDVVDFARNKPEQFNLEKMREGNRVCQFYTKQCRIEISEEDYLLVKSGMPERLIPPQPIVEDEEKELGTLEILEKNLSGVVQLADQGEICLIVSRRFPI